MGMEKERLVALIEYARQTALLRGKPASTVAQHKLFSVFEHDLQGLPGVTLNRTDQEGEDEVWLAVQRLRETEPPEVKSALLRPWLRVSQSPGEEPRLLDTTVGESLIAAGTHRNANERVRPDEAPKPTIDPQAVVRFGDYDRASLVQVQLENYLKHMWQPWAEVEKPRRKTIRLYAELFTLKQQLEGGIVDSQIELVWGVGVGIWLHGGTTVSYPLLSRLVELSLNPETSEVEIRPRDLDARLEVDWYASVDNPGVPALERKANDFLAGITQTFSPFDAATYEPLLRTAVTYLDASGRYWPDMAPPENRALPRPDNRLKVTNTWVLFARQRSNNLMSQDLERLKAQIEQAGEYPPTVKALVTEPGTENPEVQLPWFRGVSVPTQVQPSQNGNKPRDLYFPKPFNDEQLRIIQLLDVFDGVVVQGPPGTGKTHTIANVICHYLADGKRVLVTSMKDQALAVLHEQLPRDIQPLAISLLTSERDGMKQFEHAIFKIASEVQSLDRVGARQTIEALEQRIDALHGRLARIDRQVDDWARKNLTAIALDGESIQPLEAAHEVVENAGQYEWIPDSLGVGTEHDPQFSNADIVSLREARRILGEDIDYLGASLPQLIEFPDPKSLLETHQDLAHFELLKRSIASGTTPRLADSSLETLAQAQRLYQEVGTLRQLRTTIDQAGRPWTSAVRSQLHRSEKADIFGMLESLGAEIEEVMEARKAFLARPVFVPPEAEMDTLFNEGLANLAAGKNAFGIKGLFGKSTQKQWLESSTVLGQKPSSPEDWLHVTSQLRQWQRQRQLVIRWNELARELNLETFGERPDDCVSAAEAYALYARVKAMVNLENQIAAEASAVFPYWQTVPKKIDAERLDELERALQHHLQKDRLANVWATKERFQKILNGRDGRIIERIGRFLAERFGSPEVGDAELQAEWSDLMRELARVLGLAGHLAVVSQITDRIEASGAPRYAASLKQPLNGPVDHLLPDHLSKAWRWKRLSAHLEAIDGGDELEKLARDRQEVEQGLLSAYRDIVARRTWLKLADNASPSIRAALQGYLNAVQKIGKGTGKRAVRYRRDAREAAARANPAVPCWIMPHYRVSESLPAELGCFDLVVIDEASQSDLTALPALMRAKKVLIVGDDKQVSPEGVGLEEEKIRSLMDRFLGNQVPLYRQQMSPDRSIYDLYKVVFANSTVMLKEHFRCVAPIIEFSKREFYNHELKPLRVPRASERVDPPLIDVVVEDGVRRGNVNQAEARFIVEEIKALVADPKMESRSIGVVSLLAADQAQEIWKQLTEQIGPEVMQRHRVTCGDARTFQGKERDIMFLSMVAAPNEGRPAPLSRDTFAQRYNVAASRARDRMYLVRSVEADHLSEADWLRRGLIRHFAEPFTLDETHTGDLRKLCESPFEREMFDELTSRGYRVTPQVRVGQYRIDLVVEGYNDARLAVECDGDQYHGPAQWADDMQRQRVLERAGWVFWRCFASAFVRRRKEVVEDLVGVLRERGIEPDGAGDASQTIHVEHRKVSVASEGPESPKSMGEVASPPETETFDAEASPAVPQPALPDLNAPTTHSEPSPYVPGPSDIWRPRSADVFRSPEADLPYYRSQLAAFGIVFEEYRAFEGTAGGDPRRVGLNAVTEGIIRIVDVEGPVVAQRVYDVYLRGCGIKRLGHDLRATMNRALSQAIRRGRVVALDEGGTNDQGAAVLTSPQSRLVKVRTRGPRSLSEIPPSELQLVARYLERFFGFEAGSEEHLRAMLECFDLKRLTDQVGLVLLEILDKKLPYVDDLLHRSASESESDLSKRRT